MGKNRKRKIVEDNCKKCWEGCCVYGNKSCVAERFDTARRNTQPLSDIKGRLNLDG